MLKKKKKKTKAPGLPPGTIVYTGDESSRAINIEIFTFDNDTVSRKKCLGISQISLQPEKTNWINVDGVHDIGLMREMGEKFQIDNFILEDMSNINQRPKIEERDNHIFITLKMLRFDTNLKKVISEQISLLISETYLLTFQEEPGDVFNPIRDRIESGIGKIRKKSHDYLAYSVLDAIVDNYFIVLEHMEEEIDSLEERIIHNSSKEDLYLILKLKQDFIALKRAMMPTREVMIKLSHTKNINLFKEDMHIYVNDVYDHSLIIYELVENMGNRVTSLIEIYHSTVNSLMNDTMKVLTIMSTIFVPLTFLAGVYGMNFKYMPELDMKYGYATVLLVMLITAFIMLRVFKKKKWL